MRRNHDIIVIGGGHAGAEAAWAAAQMGARVALITMDVQKIGAMSCNPAIGGLAKGQMVCEIDALGGLMGLAADAAGIQFRMLNVSKGPAVWGPRCQCDKYAYARQVQALLRSRSEIDLVAGTVDRLVIKGQRCCGVDVAGTAGPRRMGAASVVLTTGTFMRGLMHTGERKCAGGRVGEGAAVGISAELARLGFELGRLKTGTPPRLAAETIDFGQLEVQPGDDQPQAFSGLTCLDGFPHLPQRDCHITHTGPVIHDLIRANLHRAPMYNGQIQTAGPRYCPSIEDKVVRFADRSSHHIYLEPESLTTNEIYCNGISTSLPTDVQERMVRLLPGCAAARILRHGYAVEYDMVWPHQIDSTCMTKRVEGLFLAGQINGTSGYEEAAGQGLIAGLNGVRLAAGKPLVRLGRDQAYLGVMMDDLVTKTPREPYRMFTSRAEYRLRLRADNAPERLTPLGRHWSLVDDARWAHHQQRQHARCRLLEHLRFEQDEGQGLLAWAQRPQVCLDQVARRLAAAKLNGSLSDRRIVASVVAELRYAGYIERQQRQVSRLNQQESRTLPAGIDYLALTGLRSEARTVLTQFRPATIGQAGRLAGVTPADLMLLTVALRR